MSMLSTLLQGLTSANAGLMIKATAATAAAAKRRETMAKKKMAKWGAVFNELGGAASTNTLAKHTGRCACSILKAVHELEDLGVVTRAGTVLKSGGPGKAQIIWKWEANAD